MATALNLKDAQDLLAKQTRVRGGYVETWNRLLASEDPAWDVTEDHKGIKLQSAFLGYKNAIEKNDTLKGKVRAVLTDGKLYLIKL